MVVLILTAKLFSIIPDVYPHSCEDSWLFMSNDNDTALTCTNDLCPIKNSFKLKSALDLLKVTDVSIGQTTSLKMVLTLGLSSHMDLFEKAFHPEQVTREAWEIYGPKLLLIADAIRVNNENGGIPLADYMDAWGCETLGSTRAGNIFATWHTPQQFYDAFDTAEAMQEYIGKVCNISPYCKTVASITEFLLGNKYEILEVAENIKFKEVSIKKEFLDTAPVVICITDSIIYSKEKDDYDSSNREDFVKWLVDKYHMNLRYSKSLTQKTDYLINDEGNRKGKWKKIKNEPAYSGCVITRSDVMQTVLEVMQGNTENVYSANVSKQVNTF